MRRLLLAVFLFLLLGILLSLVFRHHQGYVLIAFHGWQIETSLLFACAVILVGIWVLAVLWRILTTLVLAPRNVRGYFGRRRQRKARLSLYRGLEHWAEARWARAEAELQRLDKTSEAPGLGHLFSARAAQQRSHLAERDVYLEKAAADGSVSGLAVLMTRAELQIAAGQIAEAGNTLAHLHKLEPRHPWVLKMYGEQLMASGEYDRLYELLPELKRHAALTSDRFESMTDAAYRHRLASQDDLDGLTAAWRRIPKELRSKPDLLHQYALCLQKLQAEDEAANVIRDALKTQWNAPLALLFGNLQCSDLTKQLATVEEWIHAHGKKPELMLVAGRLCLRNRLWGRARSYFEASQMENAVTNGLLLELGHVYEQVNEFDQARETYRKGLELHVSQ